ncbi:SgcJ/EcaC family oxidoreductase [Spirillospora sp. NPDC048832]
MTATIESAATTTAAPSKARRPRGRRVKRILGLSALVLGLAGAGGYLWLSGTSGVRNVGEPDCENVTPTGAAADGHADDHAGVCATLRALTDAWGRGDADAYGKVFTEDATYTTYVGTYYEGREDIVEGHRALFRGFLKGTKLADSFLSVRFYGPSTAVVTSRGDTYKGKAKKPGDLSKTQTYTLVRQDDGVWRIAAFHNTKRQRVMERISFLFAPDTRPAAER